MAIRLLVLDIDGVLSDGEAKTLDLALLARLAELNRAGRRDPDRPQITLCTGRPAPYVELMLQAIDGRQPAVFEHGAGLYDPVQYSFHAHPAHPGHDLMLDVRQRLLSTIVGRGSAYFQPGKEYSLTIFPIAPETIASLAAKTTVSLGPLAQDVALIPSVSCLNIVARDVHKGRGLNWLAELTGIAPEKMLGVGDSEGDLPFLELVGHSAAPANAEESVRQRVDYVSDRPTSAGLMDILRAFAIAG